MDVEPIPISLKEQSVTYDPFFNVWVFREYQNTYETESDDSLGKPLVLFERDSTQKG